MYLIGFVVLWFVVLVSGTVFYSQYDNIGLDRGFYNAVSMAYTIGWCPSPISTEDNGSKMFSTIYIICGGFGFVAVTVFIAETIINGNDKWFAMYLQRATMKRKDMTILEKIGSFYEDYFYTICSWLVVLFFIFLGIVWSLAVVGWTITDAVLFTFSTLARCGIGGLPEDTPAWAFAFAGFYGAFSIIAVSLAIGFTSENVLTSLQNERATSIVNDRPTKKELGFLKEIGCDVTNNADSLTKNQFMLLVVARLGLVDYDLIRLVYQRFDNIKADAVDFNENVPTRRDFYSQGLRTFLEVKRACMKCLRLKLMRRMHFQ